MQLKVKKLDENSVVPTRSYDHAAGYDLYTNEDVVLYPLAVNKVHTGIAVEIPEGYYGQIFEKSGLASQGIAIRGGVIDNSYRGEIVVMMNYIDHPFGFRRDFCTETAQMELVQEVNPPIHLKRGNKIAQLVLLPYGSAEIEEVEELSDTVRGDKGFGSSGK